MLGRLAAGILRRDLGGVRRRLPRALESHHARARPGDRIALGVGDGDHRIVEAGVHMGDAGGDVLALAPPEALRFACHKLQSLISSWRRRGSKGPPAERSVPGTDHFFLPAIGLALPLRVRALVWVRWPRTGRPLR